MSSQYTISEAAVTSVRPPYLAQDSSANFRFAPAAGSDCFLFQFTVEVADAICELLWLVEVADAGLCKRLVADAWLGEFLRGACTEPPTHLKAA